MFAVYFMIIIMYLCHNYYCPFEKTKEAGYIRKRRVVCMAHLPRHESAGNYQDNWMIAYEKKNMHTITLNLLKPWNMKKIFLSQTCFYCDRS